jgi:glutathione synthase/RimK-type ligase-like ATP-grasp enzyme
LEFDFNSKTLVVNECEITYIWFRKYIYNIQSKERTISSEERDDLNHILFSVYYAFKAQKKSLGMPLEYRFFNRYNMLNSFQEAGMSFPITKVFFNNKKGLSRLMKNIEYKILRKEIGDVKKDKSTNTNRYYDLLHPSDSLISSCLVQEFVDKEYELRVIWLAGKFYSIGKFTGIEQACDSRALENVDSSLIEIPMSVQNILSNHLKELDIDFCCIDLIVKNGEYYFLDLNPHGQFEHDCKSNNLDIHKSIAKILLNEN